YEIRDVDLVTDTFGAVSGVVTRLTAKLLEGKPAAIPAVRGLPPISDRRQVVIYELVGDEIVPAARIDGKDWTGGTLSLNGRKAGDDGVEVGLTIAGGRFQAGVVIALSDLRAGRQLVLSDGVGGKPQP